VEKIEGRKAGPTREIILKPELIIRRTCGFHLRGYQRNGLEERTDLPWEGPFSVGGKESA